MNLKRDLLDIVKKNKVLFLGGILASVSELIFSLLIPYINGNIIDEGILKKKFKLLILMCIILAIMYILQYVFTMFSSYVFTKISKEYTTHIYTKMVHNIIVKKHSFFVNQNSGEILQRISEVWQLEDVFSVELLQAALSIVLFFVSLVLLVNISVKMTLLALGCGIVIFILYYYGSQLLEKYLPNVLDKNVTLTSKLEEIISGVFEIRVNQAQDLFTNEMEKEAKSKLQENMKLAVFPSMFFNATTTLTSLLLVGILYISGLDIIAGTLKVGNYFMITSYVQMLIAPTMQIGFLINTLKPVFVIADRLKENFSEESTMMYCENIPEKVEDVKSLNVISVGYSYLKKEHVFHNMSFDVSKGEILLLKGANGSGKSTLINLLCGEIEDYIGDILLDSKRQVLRKYTTVARQQPFIFNKSIKDNIILAENYDNERYEELIQKLHFYEYFNDKILEDYYLVEENGKNLSGGQVKLIAFARCIYRQKPIIILDEIISNMDCNMRNIILDYLKEIKKKHIIIIIEHTDEYKDIADKIINMQDFRDI